MSDIQDPSAPEGASEQTSSPELQICGWMHFKHQESGLTRISPAIATVLSRPVSWGEPTRMALSLRSPVADAAGDWEEVRHASWAQRLVPEAKQWTPMGFSPNDPSIEPALAARIAQLLESNPREMAKKRAPERRARMCRFDHWLPGWGTDLAWDPFKDLGVASAKELMKMAAEGLIPQDGPEILDHWLAQPVTDAPKRRYSNYGKASESKSAPQASSAKKVDAPAASPAAAAPQANAPTAPPSQAPEASAAAQPEPTAPASPPAQASSVPPAQPNPAPAAPPAPPSSPAQASAVAPAQPKPAVQEESPFDDLPALSREESPFEQTPPLADSSPAPFEASSMPDLAAPMEGLPVGELAGEPDLDIPPPESAPDWAMDIGGFDDAAFAAAEPQTPLPQDQAPTAAEPEPKEPEPQEPQEPHEPHEDHDATDEFDAAAKSIFAGPDLPDFSAIALAAGAAWTAKDAQRARSQENQAPRPEPQTAQQPATPQAAPKERSLALAFARYPAHGDDGAVRWETALLSVDGFMPKELFEAAKPHWRATREGAKRKESLYGMGLMQACLDKAQAFVLEGLAPSDKFIARDESGAKLDAQNFALNALSRSGFEPAANITALVRAKHYRDRLEALCKSAQREPAGELPEQGWIQVSPGAVREDATRVHPQAGLISWSRQGQRLAAKLAQPQDRAKLAKLAESLAVAASHAKPAHPSPTGLVPAGAAEPREISRPNAPKGRP